MLVYTITLIVLCALVLILVLTVAFLRSEIGVLKDLCYRMRGGWARTESIARKLDLGVTWLLEDKGVTIEESNSICNPYYIIPLKDKWHIKGYRREINDIWGAIYPHREAIAQALLDAFKEWDEEREAKKEAKKGKKK